MEELLSPELGKKYTLTWHVSNARFMTTHTYVFECLRRYGTVWHFYSNGGWQGLAFKQKAIQSVSKKYGTLKPIEMTAAQEKFIRENHRRQSIVDMARILELLPDEVLEFVTENKLGVTRPVLPVRTNHVAPYKRRGYSHKSFTDNDKLL